MPPVAATGAARSVWRDSPAHRGRRATGPAHRGPRRARATGGRSSQSRLEPHAVGRADVVQGGVAREAQAVPPDRDAHPGDGPPPRVAVAPFAHHHEDRKSTRLNSSHSQISYAVFCLKKKKNAPPHVVDTR